MISQETFDEIVKENMEEFGLEKDEAIKEAIKEFESQVNNLYFFHLSINQQSAIHQSFVEYPFCTFFI